MTSQTILWGGEKSVKCWIRVGSSGFGQMAIIWTWWRCRFLSCFQPMKAMMSISSESTQLATWCFTSTEGSTWTWIWLVCEASTNQPFESQIPFTLHSSMIWLDKRIESSAKSRKRLHGIITWSPVLVQDSQKVTHNYGSACGVCNRPVPLDKHDWPRRAKWHDCRVSPQRYLLSKLLRENGRTGVFCEYNCMYGSLPRISGLILDWYLEWVILTLTLIWRWRMTLLCSDYSRARSMAATPLRMVTTWRPMRMKGRTTSVCFV